MKITNQQAFDAALFGVRGQRYQQAEDAYGCVYRGDGGLKCGIGHSMPDELVELCQNKGGIVRLTSDQGIPKIQAFYSDCDRRLLSELQGAHDEMVSGLDFERRMRTIAADFGLTFTELPK